MPLDYETRQMIRQAWSDHRKAVVGRSLGVRFATLNRPRKRNKDQYYKLCIRGCGRCAWHPPQGSGRCRQCAVRESIPTRKPRTSPNKSTKSGLDTGPPMCYDVPESPTRSIKKRG